MRSVGSKSTRAHPLSVYSGENRSGTDPPARHSAVVLSVAAEPDFLLIEGVALEQDIAAVVDGQLRSLGRQNPTIAVVDLRGRPGFCGSPMGQHWRLGAGE